MLTEAILNEPKKKYLNKQRKQKKSVYQRKVYFGPQIYFELGQMNYFFIVQIIFQVILKSHKTNLILVTELLFWLFKIYWKLLKAII